jgi:hypothetical protein
MGSASSHALTDPTKPRPETSLPKKNPALYVQGFLPPEYLFGSCQLTKRTNQGFG